MRAVTEYEVAIIGAGPAGSAAAAVLGSLGKRVLLIDKTRFPRTKTCGDAVTASCLPLLSRLGIAEEVVSHAGMVSESALVTFDDQSTMCLRAPPSHGQRCIAFMLT